jgi:predicted GIY-YIG superfamily endonuclease
MKEYNGIINISEPDNDYSIYKMYSSNEKDNSIYIGVTKDYKQRVYKHSRDRRRKEHSDKPLYMWLNQVIDEQERNVIFEVIEKELSENNAFEKEIIYIQNYKDLDYDVLNISQGGKGYKGNIPWNKGKKNHLSEEQIKNLSESHLGQGKGEKRKNHSNETKKLISLKNEERKYAGWVSLKRKTVYKYDNNNVLLTSYSSLKEAGLKEGSSPTSIGEWCRKDKQPRNEFFWSYEKLN